MLESLYVYFAHAMLFLRNLIALQCIFKAQITFATKALSMNFPMFEGKIGTFFLPLSFIHDQCWEISRTEFLSRVGPNLGLNPSRVLGQSGPEFLYKTREIFSSLVATLFRMTARRAKSEKFHFALFEVGYTHSGREWSSC